MIKRLRPLLGTFVEIVIADPGCLPESQIQQAMNAAFSGIEKIQQQLSFHHSDSDLTRLNCANGKRVTFNSPGIYCLKLARALMRINTAFNCTLGKAMVDHQALPAPATTSSAVEDIGTWDDIDIHQHQVRLRRPLWITLDGIAKGFAIDQGIKILRRSGIAAAWINAGGDIRVYGSVIMPVSIRDHQGRDHPMGGLQNAAIATSTSHYTTDCPGLLLNPGTLIAGPQKPAPTLIPSGTWTVIARSAWRADALTKVAANTPAGERQETIRKLGGNWIALD